jgi:hypothetical protein
MNNAPPQYQLINKNSGGGRSDIKKEMITR